MLIGQYKKHYLYKVLGVWKWEEKYWTGSMLMTTGLSRLCLEWWVFNCCGLLFIYYSTPPPYFSILCKVGGPVCFAPITSKSHLYLLKRLPNTYADCRWYMCSEWQESKRLQTECMSCNRMLTRNRLVHVKGDSILWIG